jgi:hypothetical protein
LKQKEAKTNIAQNISFRSDGCVDGRCASVRSGAVFLTKSGEIDKRSQAVRSGLI